MCDETIIPNDGAGFVVKPPPCDEQFEMILKADGKTPVSLLIDGNWFDVRPKTRPGRINLTEGETFFTVVQAAYYVAIRAAHRGMVRKARALGLVTESMANSSLAAVSVLVREIAELESAFDGDMRSKIGGAS